MNVMIAADYAAPKSGNFVASMIALGKKLKINGDYVLFVFPTEKEWISWFRKEGLTVRIVNRACDREREQHQLEALIELVSEYQIDLIHSHFGMFHHELVYNRCTFKNVKIILHDHMDFSLKPHIAIQYIRTAIYSFIYSLKDINVISVMEEKNKAYIFLKNKCFLPNGLSLERHIEYSMTREECRNKLGLGRQDKCVFMLGWDLKRKGLDIALKAVQKCRENDSNICFGIIGVGTVPTNNVKKFIERETGIDSAEPWIHFFDSYEDMFAVHRAVDVYLSASRKEAFSYGLLESISQNTPVVVSDISGTRWAEMYNNCFFYPVEDMDACADAILKALSSGRKDTNSSEIVARYGIDQWCDKVIEIYSTVK
ncbi:glycosyltransferase family 4 protein [Lacrimispora saccharolytica]|nr:glycosyltransferase family 4 protein [Lacrimispora saccharolytica]